MPNQLCCDTADTPGSCSICAMKEYGNDSVKAMLLATIRRLTLARSIVALNAAFTPCNMPNSRKATRIDARVNIVRAFLRHSAAQISGRNFTPPPWRFG